MHRQSLTTTSWDLPDDVFAEGEVKPKKKSAKAKANGAANAANTDGDSKKRTAAEVSLFAFFQRSHSLVFLTAVSLTSAAGNGAPGQATTARLSCGRGLNNRASGFLATTRERIAR